MCSDTKALNCFEIKDLVNKLQSSEAPTQLFVIILLLYLFVKLSYVRQGLYKNFQFLFIFFFCCSFICRRKLVNTNPVPKQNANKTGFKTQCTDLQTISHSCGVLTLQFRDLCCRGFSEYY